ncbi:MAG: tetratricopeptide repeat protein [Acidimicrobiia bacterium]
MRRPCGEPGCTGTVLDDGYCDTCGTKWRAPAAEPARAAGPTGTGPGPAGPGRSSPRPAAPGASRAVGSTRSTASRRTSSTRSAATSRRSGIGAGLVEVPPAPSVDPATVIMRNPEVSEDKRFCANCGAEVGRSKTGRPGRASGFCAKCRNPYDFRPKLSPGELVAGQYEVAGALAHGGLGWIYLVKDKAVNGRWSVLKGLLDSGDEAAMAVAVAERAFLAEIQHPAIVEIYNFVSHKGSGYIVMEYVGGPSLKQILKRRREAKGGPDPLPVDQAIAYVHAILPALSYLHGRGLVYNDFKPDNVIQVGDQVKLIDVGGVRRLDDPTGDIYGTVGFQAPEIADMGPSLASDVYTVGRTLAVMTMDFRGYQTTYVRSLPDPSEQPLLAQWGSFHRLLLKATADHPDDRFQSIAELGDQMLGVLREVVAVTTGKPQPAPSTVFAGASSESELPLLTIDPSDPAAGLLANLGADPAEALRAIDEAVAAGQVPETVELRLRRARALIDAGRPPAAVDELERIENDDPWEWRAVWLRGVAALDAGDAPAAAAAFDRCRSEVPGELAPKLAAAMAAERAGELAAAADLYATVSTVDPAYVGAATGLARCRLAQGDVPGALAAYARIPRTHRAHGEAQVAAVRALVGRGRYVESSQLLGQLEVERRLAATLDVELFEAALAAVVSGSARPDPAVKLRGGYSLEEESLRRGLERACRWLAKLTPDPDERRRLVDRANQVRPFSLV